MKNLSNLSEDIRKKVTPLITYFDKYYAYNEEESNKQNLVYYGNKSDYVKLEATDDELKMSYSNYMSVVFVKQNYPFAKVEGDSVIFNYDKPLPYVLIYVTIDKSLDI